MEFNYLQSTYYALSGVWMVGTWEKWENSTEGGKQHGGSKTLGKVLPALKTITVPSNSFFFLKQVPILLMGSPGGSVRKESACNAGDLG